MFNMVFGIKDKIKDRTLEEILKTLDKIVDNPDDLEHWTLSIETAAKDMGDYKRDKIDFEYYRDERVMKFFVKDAKSRDDLVNSVEVHLPLIPESLQGFFRVFKYNLKISKVRQKLKKSSGLIFVISYLILNKKYHPIYSE
jgi:hypothetical protein